MTKALAAGAHSVRSRVCHAVHKLMAMVTASERVTSHCMADIAPARRNGLRGSHREVNSYCSLRVLHIRLEASPHSIESIDSGSENDFCVVRSGNRMYEYVVIA